MDSVGVELGRAASIGRWKGMLFSCPARGSQTTPYWRAVSRNEENDEFRKAVSRTEYFRKAVSRNEECRKAVSRNHEFRKAASGNDTCLVGRFHKR